MKFFIDTADIKEIKELNSTGLVDGVTTNPSLIAKTNNNFLKTIKEICKIVSGPVSAEVTALDVKGMIKQGKKLAELSDNVVIKVPLTWNGLKACKNLRNEGIMVNVTLCFSAAQAILAAKAGASFISPFIGRLDDISHDGQNLIREIVKIYSNYRAITTQILVASIRSPSQVIRSAELGAHISTIPPNILKMMVNHPLTDKGIDSFLKDWRKTGQNI